MHSYVHIISCLPFFQQSPPQSHNLAFIIEIHCSQKMPFFFIILAVIQFTTEVQHFQVVDGVLRVLIHWYLINQESDHTVSPFTQLWKGIARLLIMCLQLEFRVLLDLFKLNAVLGGGLSKDSGQSRSGLLEGVVDIGCFCGFFLLPFSKEPEQSRQWKICAFFVFFFLSWCFFRLCVWLFFSKKVNFFLFFFFRLRLVLIHFE